APEDSLEATDELADSEVAAATEATTEATTEAVDDESAPDEQTESAELNIPLTETESTETDASTPEDTTPVEDDGPDDILLDASDEDAQAESRLVVIGNSQFVADGNFTELGNGDLFLNSINWLSNRTEAITIRPKSPTNRRFTIGPAGLQWLRLLTVVLLPASALSLGAAQWWRRR
ncbi:MAG: hypothetical protein AAF974_10350, partial [Cyanobacteria bacterium P01_E01_bin.34]